MSALRYCYTTRTSPLKSAVRCRLPCDPSAALCQNVNSHLLADPRSVSLLFLGVLRLNNNTSTLYLSLSLLDRLNPASGPPIIGTFRRSLPVNGGSSERRAGGATCAPWRDWLPSWRRRVSSSTCCPLTFRRERSPAGRA